LSGSITEFTALLLLQCEKVPDPFSLAEDKWVDDVRRWPQVEFGDIYTYLIETKGEYTKESLKAYKSLEAFNFFHSGYVRTVFYYECSHSSKVAVLKAEINPSQRSQDKPHSAWVTLLKENGSVVTGHCTCMAGYVSNFLCTDSLIYNYPIRRGEVCSHVAAILFKVEAACRLGYTKPSCTSEPCSWNSAFSTKVHTNL